MRQLDAPRLPATTRVNLGLHDNGATEFGSDGCSLFGCFRHPSRVHRHSIASQYFRRLILMDIHRRRCSFRHSQNGHPRPAFEPASVVVFGGIVTWYSPPPTSSNSNMLHSNELGRPPRNRVLFPG